MLMAFMGPPPAYRSQRPEKPEQPKRPQYTRMSESVTLQTGTFIQKAWLATCVTVLILAVMGYGIGAMIVFMIQEAIKYLK